ncbi:MAG: hypothetical protein GY748_23295 [Planctomycetaceae bacterium]|nr:hypothetical protein [Planctomycetaceae bacterium]
MASPKGSRAKAAERRNQSLELRKAGASYRSIGRQLGISAPQAHRDVAKSIAELKKLGEENAQAVRELEVQRLDAMLLGLWPQARTGHQGSVDRVLRIMQRRASLLGLDAPARQDVTSGGEQIKAYAVVSPDDWDEGTDEN